MNCWEDPGRNNLAFVSPRHRHHVDLILEYLVQHFAEAPVVVIVMGLKGRLSADGLH